MGVLKMATAKIGDMSLFDSGVSLGNATLEVSALDYRTPDYGLMSGKSFYALGTGYSATAYGAFSLTAADDELYARIAFKMNSYASTDLALLHFLEGSTSHVLVSVNPGVGNVRAFRSTTSTVLATSNGNVWTPYSWVCLEVYVKIADSGGRVVVRVNGNTTPVLDYTGDTRNSGTGLIDNIRMGMCSGGASGIEMYFDDLMLRDDAWCGTGGIYLLTPNAAGDEAAWTASQGDAWDCVNEVPPSFNDYISTPAANVGAVSLFGLQNLPIAPTAVTAVGVYARARMSAPGSGLVRVAVKSGATVVYGPAVALDVGEVWAAAHYHLDPNGSAAWSESSVNALQIGIKNG